MIPIFRTLASSVAVAVAATVMILVPALDCLVRFRCAEVLICSFAVLRLALPAVVGERLVGLGHLVHVLTALDTRAETIAGIKQFVHQPLGHGLLAARARIGDQP